MEVLLSRVKWSWVSDFWVVLDLDLDLIVARFLGGGMLLLENDSAKGRLRLSGGEEERVDGGEEGRGARTREL